MLWSVCLCLVLGASHARVTWRTYTGNQEQLVRIRTVDIEETDFGGRQVTVTFEASHAAQVIWYVDGKIVLNYDTRFITISRGNSASLVVGADDTDKSLVFSVVLKVVKAEVYIQLEGAVSGTYEIANHTVHMSPKERMNYGRNDASNIKTDVALWVDNASYRTKINAMLTYVDYCSRPIRPKFGFTGSRPQTVEVLTPAADDEFLGRSDWRQTYPAGQTATKRIKVNFAPRGLLRVTAGFSSRSIPVSKVNIENTLLFKPAHLPYVIDRNTVMFIGWNRDVYADLNTDVDFHIFAVGNPTPRIMLAKGRRDVSTIVERQDIEQAFVKETIFRFRNVTAKDSGRYLCTAQSGGGEVENSFVLYVRKPCSRR